jgi:hypothetical protein
LAIRNGVRVKNELWRFSGALGGYGIEQLLREFINSPVWTKRAEKIGDRRVSGHNGTTHFVR